MPVPIPDHEPRGAAELRRQFEIEHELATRLLRAGRDERRTLYAAVYDEFLRRVPDQPQARQSADPEARRHLVALQTELLEPFLHQSTAFLEIGAGDASLALELARRVASVVAIEASGELLRDLEPPFNLRLLIADVPPYPLPAESIDLAFSSHVIEHLHPDDAADHASEIHRLLQPGGHYVVVTPNRLLGPHDVSRYFADRAQGLHLREYSHGGLGRLLHRAGFAQVRVLRGIGRPPELVPLTRYRLVEALVSCLPLGPRRKALERWGARRGMRQPFRPLEQVKLMATKARGA